MNIYERKEAALRMYRFYVDASDEEVKRNKITRDEALRLARAFDPSDGSEEDNDVYVIMTAFLTGMNVIAERSASFKPGSDQEYALR